MQFYLETPRLILRDLQESDVDDFYKMDSNSDVHLYLGNNPITSKHKALEIIQIIRQQYTNNDIGRWAMIEKQSGKFMGWSGLKLVTEEWNNHINFYDVGYRIHPNYWHKGYATESCKASIEYGFQTLNLHKIIGTANQNNKASLRVLEKCGLQFVEKFMWKDIQCNWLQILKKDWNAINNEL